MIENLLPAPGTPEYEEFHRKLHAANVARCEYERQLEPESLLKRIEELQERISHLEWKIEESERD